MKKFLLTSGLIFTLILLPFSISFAVMQLIPPIQEIEVQRGRTETFSIVVKNVGDEDVPSRFVAYDMDVSVEGRPDIADSTIADSIAADSTLLDSLSDLLWTRGCGKWITLDQSEAMIKAHESITLTGTITAPMDADGGYYALIKGFFVGSDFESESEQDKKTIRLESQAAVVLLVRIPSSRNRAIIYPDTIIVYPMGEKGRDEVFDAGHETGWSVLLPVRNVGNIHTVVSGAVSFWTASGTKIEAAELKGGKGYVLPGRVRNFRASGTDFLSDGYFMIRISLQNDQGMNVTKSFPFAIVEGDVYPGALSDDLKELLRTATPAFRLKQPFLTREVTPGGSSFMAVQLQSVVEDTALLIPHVTNWKLSEAGGAILTDEDDPDLRSCKSWFEFTEDRFILAPGRNKSFKMRINVPEDVAGEYYAAIVFYRDSTKLDLPDEFLGSRTQLIALATTQGTVSAIEVDSIETQVLRDPSMTLHRFMFTVRNVGNMHCYAHGNLSLEKEVSKGLYDPVGKAREFGNVALYILPGGQRTYAVDVPNLEPGKYRSILAVTYRSGEQPLVNYQVYELK